jgi:uncharacterized repeat protein (TIGR01451 family)
VPRFTEVPLARLRAVAVCVVLVLVLVLAASAQAAPRELFTSEASAGTAAAYTIGTGGALSAAGSAVSTGSTANNPNGAVVSPDGRYLFVTNAGADTVSVFAINQTDGTLSLASTTAPVSNIQAMEALAISRDGTHLYATGNSSGNGAPGNSRVAVFDIGAGGALTLTGPVVDTGQPSYSYVGSTAVAIAPDGSHLYVTTSEPAGTSSQGPYLQSDAVTEFPISASDGSLGPPVTVSPGTATMPLGISVSPDGGHLYVAESNTTSIDTYAIAADGTLSGLTKTNSGSGATANPEALEVARDGKHLYVANASGGSTSSVSELPIAADGSLGTAQVTADTQRAPVSLAITPDDNYVYTGDYYCSSSGCSVAEFPVQADGSLGAQATTVATGGPGFFALAAAPRQAPAAAFSAVAAGAGTASGFDGSASSDPTGTIARYDWSWGDGSSSPDGGATPSHTFAATGTYSVTLTVTNDAGCSTTTLSAGQTAFCNGSTSATTTQQITIGKATPTITTHASGDVPVHGQITDTATLTGGANPTGAITFELYGPNDPTCAGTPVQTTKAVNGNASYTSDPQTPSTPGAYRWIASYGGDANNVAITGGCSDPNEQVTVSPGGDLSVTGSGAPAAPKVGDDITYTFTVGDAGDDAQGVTFTDALPPGVSFVSAASSQGGCSGSAAISCSLGLISGGSHAVVSVIVKATQAGLVSDTGHVTGSNFDPNGANNQATVAAQVSAPVVAPPGNVTPPVVSTGGASHVSQHGAVLHGTLNPGGATATYYFEYGRTTRYGLATRRLTLSGNAPEQVSALVGSLRLGTRYHFRLVAVNSARGAYGNDRALTTVGRLKPRLTFSVSPRNEVLGGLDTDDAPFHFTVSGSLHLPAGVAAPGGCRGRVEIRFRTGKTGISRTVGVSKTCRYDAHVIFWAGGENRSGSVRVSVSFNGNAALKARSAPSVTIGYSEQGTLDTDPRRFRQARDAS